MISYLMCVCFFFNVRASTGLVMICFSPDDMFLLSSAVDNEVTQYTALDGRRHTNFDMPKTNLCSNFTRAYYSCSGRFVLSGSSEERLIRLHCASTGAHLQSAQLYPGRRHHSIYIQSLRWNSTVFVGFVLLFSFLTVVCCLKNM